MRTHRPARRAPTRCTLRLSQDLRKNAWDALPGEMPGDEPGHLPGALERQQMAGALQHGEPVRGDMRQDQAPLRVGAEAGSRSPAGGGAGP